MHRAVSMEGNYNEESASLVYSLALYAYYWVMDSVDV
ncbi:MAG: hypothetical protein ACI935_000299 [Moritella dasanensis]|jgi:hypothetical protein